MVSSEPASCETIIRFSLWSNRVSEIVRVVTRPNFDGTHLCCLFNSVSSVNTVIPMIPFIGVLISCDMLARNSLFDLFASSAACRACVFFEMDSRKVYTI